MKLPINPITQKKLVIVRQLFESASTQASSRFSPVSRIMAVIGFDLTVETILKTIVLSLDSKEQPDKQFQSLLTQANDKLQKAGFSSLPDLANIQHVHAIRNDAQHKARYPTEDDVKECQFFVEGFLRKTVHQLWVTEFRDISLVELVQNKKAQKHLQIAEEALSQDDFEKTIKESYAALVWIMFHVRTQLFGRSRELSENFDFSDVSDQIDEQIAEAIDVGFEPIRNEISYEFNRMEDALLSIAVGMNYAQFIRLQMILPIGAFVDDKGNFGVQMSLFKDYKKRVTKSDARFALNYSVDAITQIEAQIGDVESTQRSLDWEFENLK